MHEPNQPQNSAQLMHSNFTPQAIIFDCDGTLLDTQRIWTEVIHELLAANDKTLDPAVASTFVGGTVEAVVGAIAQILQADPHTVGNELGRRYYTYLADPAHEGKIPLMPGARESLEILSRKLPLAVASNSTQPHLSENLEQAGLLPFVDFVVSADDVPQGKPAPDIYLRAAQLLGVAPEHCLVIEDSTNGAQAAIAAGMKVVFLQQIAGQESIGNYVAESLADPNLQNWFKQLAVTRRGLSTEHPLGLLRHYIPRGIVFDCDGLLLDTESVWEQSQQEILERYGITLSEAQSESLMGTTLEQTVEFICSITDINEAELQQEIKTTFTERLKNELKLMEGAMEFLELAATKVPLAVASNSWHSALLDKLERAQILPLFDNVQSSDTVENSKPAGDMYEKAVREMGLEPSRCLAFEDSPLGAQAAKAAGLKLIAIPTRQPKIEVADLNLNSLSNPDLINWVHSWPARKK